MKIKQKQLKLVTIYYIVAVLASLFLMNSCTVLPPKQPTAIDEMHATLQDSIREDEGKSTTVSSRSRSHVPQSVSDALLPSVESSTATDNDRSQRRFNVVADKMPAKVFFMGLVEGTSANMVVDPNVNGTISLSLKDVTLEEAMDAVRDVYGYEYRSTSYGYEVSPPELETQLFNVNYLDVKRSGKSITEMSSGDITSVGTIGVGSGGGSSSSTPASPVSAGQSTPTTTSSRIDTTSEINFWKDLEVSLKNIVPRDSNRSIVVNPQAGVVIVHAYPHELHQVARYLDRIQSNLQRQVIIEAKILEVQLNDAFQSGIDWSLLGNPLNGQAFVSQAANGPNGNGASGSGAFAGTQIPNFNSIFTITAKGSFRTLMQFLQTQGNIQILSSPRISTVNNQKAVIKAGQDEFFVTGVSTTNTIIGTNTLPSQNVSLTPFFSGVMLDVTPQISKNGNVILHIHPSVSNVMEQEKNITLGTSGTGSTPNTLSLPLALSTIRESDNVVRAKSGQVVVIGGLIQNTMGESVAGVPILSRIPFFGFLFRRTSQVAQKTELVILLRPVLANNRVWTEGLKREDKRFVRMKRNFHESGLTDVFGNQAEVTDRNYY